MSLTVLGDCHGEYDRYKRIIKEHEYTVQIGDMGYDYRPLMDVDPEKHKFFGGNHDDYQVYNLMPHQLGDYGPVELGGVKFFFARGAFSIDKNYRTPGFDWFPEEELTLQQGRMCVEEYKQLKPDIVLTHDCPEFLIKFISGKGILESFGWDADKFWSPTQIMLEAMYVAHQPKLWIFGHHHKFYDKVWGENGTRFICLRELETFTIGEQDEVDG